MSVGNVNVLLQTFFLYENYFPSFLFDKYINASISEFTSAFKHVMVSLL